MSTSATTLQGRPKAIPAILWGGVDCRRFGSVGRFPAVGTSGRNYARHRQRADRAARISGRVAHRRIRDGFALFYRAFGRERLLRGQPQADLSDPAGCSLGLPVRHRRIHVHELGRVAALGVSQEQSSVLHVRLGHQPAYPHVLRRAADCASCAEGRRRTSALGPQPEIFTPDLMWPLADFGSVPDIGGHRM